jgi:hypothetical protein
MSGGWILDGGPPQLKRRFTPEEDERIRQLMSTSAKEPWAEIAQQIPNRTARQIRERWLNYLSPTVNTGSWTPEEEILLQNLVAQHGPKWSKLVAHFANRTDIAIKNHWIMMERRTQKLWKAAALLNTTQKKGKPPRKENREHMKPPNIVIGSRGKGFPSSDLTGASIRPAKGANGQY